MKKLFSVALLALLTLSSFTAEARGGHRGGGHHRSGHSYSSYSRSSSVYTPVKKATPKRRVARYVAAGAVGYGAYQAHNYAASYVREKGR